MLYEVITVSISARSGEGLEDLRNAVSDCLSSERTNCWIELDGRHGRLRAQLFDGGAKRVAIATHDPALVEHAEALSDNFV